MDKKIAFSVMVMIVVAVGASASTIDFRTSLWSAGLEAEAAASSGGLKGTLIDLDKELGLDNKKDITTYEVRLNFWRRHHLFGAVWDMEYGGENVLERTVNFSGQQYRISSLVKSKVAIDFSQVGYQLDLVSGKNLSVGVVADIHLYKVDAQLEATVPGGTVATKAKLESTAGLVGLDLRAPVFRDDLLLHLRGEGMVYGVGDELFDFRGEIGWSIAQNVRLIGGYRWMQIKFDEEDFTVDAGVNGPYVGLQAEF